MTILSYPIRCRFAACEIVIARGGNRERILPIMERIADREVRRRDRLSKSDVLVIDFSLRAYTLLERLAGRNPALETYLVEPSTPADGLSTKEAERLKRSDEEKKRELQDLIGPIISLYDARAQTLLGAIAPGDIDSSFRDVISRYHGESYRWYGQPYALAMKTCSALSLTRLMALPKLDRTILFKHVNALLQNFGIAQIEIFKSLALDQSLHNQILIKVLAEAEAAKNLRTSAEDKVATLVLLARLLLPISPADASTLFNQAVAAAGEVNAEAIHELALFAPLAKHTAGSIDK